MPYPLTSQLSASAPNLLTIDFKTLLPGELTAVAIGTLVKNYYDSLPSPKKIEEKLLQLIVHYPPFKKAFLATYFGLILSKQNILYFPSYLIHPAMEERTLFLEHALEECAKLFYNGTISFDQICSHSNEESLYSFLLTIAITHPSPSLNHFLFDHIEECPSEQEEALYIHLLHSEHLRPDQKMALKMSYIDQQLMLSHSTVGDFALTRFFLNPIWICLKGISEEKIQELGKLFLSTSLPFQYPKAWSEWVMQVGSRQWMKEVIEKEQYLLLQPFYSRQEMSRELLKLIFNRIKNSLFLNKALVTEILRHPKHYQEQILNHVLESQNRDYQLAIFHFLSLDQMKSDAQLLLFLN